MSTTLNPQQLFQQVNLRHRRALEIIIKCLIDIGGEISPQKALVPIVLAEFENQSYTKDLDEKRLTEYIRKYEYLGFFHRVPEVSRANVNRLLVTNLGRELIAPKPVPKTAQSKWASKTMWKLESFIRAKRNLHINTSYSLDDLVTEVLLKHSQFGLRLLSRPDTAEKLLLELFSTRFDSYDLEVDLTTRTILVKVGLA